SSDSAGVAGYQIIRSGSVLTTVSGSTLSYADVSVTPNTLYSYAVKAYDAAGNYSTASNTDTVGTQPAIATPTGPAPSIASFTASPSTVSAGQTSVLSWNVNNATSITINNGVGNVSG